ncbi:MAG: TetR/AcrR family transcriptional regulator [Anaerolineae bacterium]
MARTVNEQEFVARRNEILDAVQRHIYAEGYEQMSIQEIRRELGISNGAFYHYFASKPAVLEALVERGQDEADILLHPVISDPNLTALEKLQRFFGTFDRLRSAQHALVIDLLRVWYSDENALVRQKVDDLVATRRAPALNTIIHQGLHEGVLTTAYPEQAGEIILNLLRGMRNTHMKWMLSLDTGMDEARVVEGIVTSHAAYMDAIEHVLGAPSNALFRTSAEDVRFWVTALQADS